MSQGYYKVVITDSDYLYTRYTTWVSARSRTKAIVQAAALAGQEKYRRERERTGREPGVEGLIEPEVRLEPCDLDEYFAKRDMVEVSS